jgi:hypothetical protein
VVLALALVTVSALRVRVLLGGSGGPLRAIAALRFAWVHLRADVHPNLTSAAASIDTPIGLASVAWHTAFGTCGVVPLGAVLNLTCGGGVFTGVSFASFGTPSGACPALSLGSCNANASMQVVAQACVGKVRSHSRHDPFPSSTQRTHAHAQGMLGRTKRSGSACYILCRVCAMSPVFAVCCLLRIPIVLGRPKPLWCVFPLCGRRRVVPCWQATMRSVGTPVRTSTSSSVRTVRLQAGCVDCVPSRDGPPVCAPAPTGSTLN